MEIFDFLFVSEKYNELTLEKYELSMAWKSNLDIAIKNGSFCSVIKRTTCILKQRKNASNCC